MDLMKIGTGYEKRNNLDASKSHRMSCRTGRANYEKQDLLHIFTKKYVHAASCSRGSRFFLYAAKNQQYLASVEIPLAPCRDCARMAYSHLFPLFLCARRRFHQRASHTWHLSC